MIDNKVIINILDERGNISMQAKNEKKVKKTKKNTILYFRYYIKSVDEDKRYLFDINKMLQNFCTKNNTKYKELFKYNGEYYYLVPIKVKSNNIQYDKFYFFISTKNNDIGKVIEESTNINISDIEEKLNNNQSLGFASYIMVQESYIAFCSTFISPKSSSFDIFMNNLFKLLKINEKFQFIMESFPIEILAEDALKFTSIGRTAIKVKAKSSFIRKLFTSIIPPEEMNYLDEFEIVAKPKKKQNITKFSKNLIELMCDEADDVQKKVQVRAKNTLGESMQEYIIFTSSKIKDIIVSENDEDRCIQMMEAANNNKLLQQDIKENEKKFSNNKCDKLYIYNDISSWNRISDL